jgi:hypothetical protein
MTFEISGHPNQRGVNMLFDAVVNWLEAGRPCYQCQECFAPLQTEEEREAHFCKHHLATRRVWTLEDALASIARSNARKAKRMARKAA